MIQTLVAGVKCVQESDNGNNDKANQYFAFKKCFDDFLGICKE